MSARPGRRGDASDTIWMIPAVNALLVRDALVKEGVSEHRLFRNTGLTPRQVETSNALLEYGQVVALLENAVQLSPAPGLGLRIGRRESVTDWGILGYAMLSCATVGEALEAITQFHKTAASMVNALFTVQDDVAMLELVPPCPLNTALPFVMEEHFSAFCSVLRMLTGVPLPMLQLELTYKEPGYHALYKSTFPGPIRFGAPRNQLFFRAGYLELPVAQSNAFSARLAKQMCSEQLQRQVQEPDFLQQIRYLLLLQGSDFPDAEAVATSLHMTSRTMRNHLRLHRTSFQALRDDVRKQLAMNYLESSGMVVADIAALLGFSDRSNFRRAFKRWAGQTPEDYRNSVAGSLSA